MYGKRNLIINLAVLMALALTSACQAGKTPTATPTPTEKQSLLYTPTPTTLSLAAEALRIMPLGNSIAEGICDRPSQCNKPGEYMLPRDGGGAESCKFNWNSSNPNAVGFRRFLRDKLTAEGVNMEYVGSIEVIEGLAHEGHAYFSIDDLDYCIRNADWLEQAHPDMILLPVVGFHEAGTSASPEQMIQRLETLLSDIYKIVPETTEVIVAQYPTRYDRYSVSNPWFPENFAETITQYNAGIPGVVEKLQVSGKHVSTVNMWDAFQSIDDYDEVGINPRSVAAERMAQIWLEKIMGILGRPVLVSASPTLQPTPTEQLKPLPTIRVDNPLRIMPLGEAVIEGQCDRPSNCIHPADMKFPRDGYGAEACTTGWYTLNPGERGFRGFLRDRLIAAGVNMSYVGSVQVVEGLAHEGHMGFLISDLDYCIQNAKWLEESKPDMILLDAGMLDLFYSWTPELAIDSLRQLLTHIYQELPETTAVIVAQISPVRDVVHVNFDPAQPMLNDHIADYNARIPGLVEEFRAKGKHVSSVDLQNTIQSTDEFDQDGGHPNPVASERMAQAWFEKIMEILGQ